MVKVSAVSDTYIGYTMLVTIVVLLAITCLLKSRLYLMYLDVLC